MLTMGQLGAPFLVLICFPIILIILSGSTHCYPSSTQNVPIMARKAGGGGRYNKPQSDPPQVTTPAPAPTSEEDYEYESSEESEEIRRNCAPGKFQFIRGGKCVPKVCYWGNSSRNMVTGECLNEPKEDPYNSYGHYERRRCRFGPQGSNVHFSLRHGWPKGRNSFGCGRYRYGRARCCGSSMNY